MKIHQTCKNYFTLQFPEQKNRPLKKKEIAVRVGKIISYFFLLPPAIMGIALGLSSLKGRAKKATSSKLGGATTTSKVSGATTTSKLGGAKTSKVSGAKTSNELSDLKKAVEAGNLKAINKLLKNNPKLPVLFYILDKKNDELLKDVLTTVKQETLDVLWDIKYEYEDEDEDGVYKMTPLDYAIVPEDEVYKMTPLDYAIVNNDKEAVKILLEKYDVNKEPRNLERKTPLHFAAFSDHIDSTEILKLILNKTNKDRITVKDTGDDTVLDDACINGSTESVKLLLPHFDINEDDASVLSSAVLGGNPEIVELLLKDTRLTNNSLKAFKSREDVKEEIEEVNKRDEMYGSTIEERNDYLEKLIEIEKLIEAEYTKRKIS